MFEWPSFEDLYQDNVFPDSIPGGGNPISPTMGRMVTRTSGEQYNPPATKLRKKGALALKDAKKPSRLKEA
jgi:hypothetical protein